MIIAQTRRAMQTVSTARTFKPRFLMSEFA
jgi:hypothetical protein